MSAREAGVSSSGATTFDVQFGTTNPPPQVSAGRTTTTFAPGALANATTYYWRIVARNVRFREGEIDIVAARAGVLAFVEVKTRRSVAFGSPAEAVTWRKQRKIRTLASRYLSERHPGALVIRFDVVDIARDRRGFMVTHLEGAF